MGGIAPSLMASHRRAQSMKERGYIPTSMYHVIGQADRYHEAFQAAIEAFRDSTQAYHDKKGEQRTALQKMNEAMARGNDATEKLDDSIEHSR